MAFHLPCQSISDSITTLSRNLGIVDAKVTEDAVWTLPQISPAGNLCNSVMPGGLLIIRNITASNVMLVAHAEDSIDSFRDATVPAESSIILSATGSGLWSILVAAQLNLMTSNSSANLLPGTPTGAPSTATTATSPTAVAAQTAQISSAQLAQPAAAADRRANMPMTRVRGIAKKR